MGLYGAFDLHASNNYLAIINERDKRVFSRTLPNDGWAVVQTLLPYKEELLGLVVESTFNWYWLVDVLMEAGYRVHLANPCAIKPYKGLKHSDDRHDAFWLAHLLRLGILPEGYIYPKEQRPVRDLLRRRGHLLRLRTSLILSLQNMISNHHGFKMTVNGIKKTTQDEVVPLFAGQDELQLNAELSKESIDFLTRKIRIIEAAVVDRVKLTEPFIHLQTMPGIGKILS